MNNIKVKMCVSIPDEIYEKFLIELERDGFVFAKFGENSLVLSKWDGEADSSVVDGKNITGLDAGRQDASVIPNKRESEEHASSNLAHPISQKGVMYGLMGIAGVHGQIKEINNVCKCGHWVEIVGTKWQHLDEAEDIPYFQGLVRPLSVKNKKLIRYREKCYYCDCIDPKPGEAHI
jgi:hypothetical protein